MDLLIEKGLMFGNLVHVESPVLVERYNRALNALTGKRTGLTDFHIDIAGFSPEIGDEFGDPLYLNHEGVNRQFILLTTDQERAPLLNSKFSTSRSILRQFIEENERELFALTVRDAVAGELVNSVYKMTSPADLFELRKLRVEADTTDGTVRTAKQLRGMIDDFKSRPDAWFDDVLIAKMISLAKTTGDVTRNPVVLPEMEFDQSNFWTAHFGGLYVFRDVKHPAVICATEQSQIGELPVPYVFDFDDRTQIAKFLELNDLVEPVTHARGMDAAAVLRQKMDFIVAHVASEQGEDLSNISRRQLRLLGRRYSANLPDEWQGLAALVRWAEEGGSWPHINSDHPAYFYTLRAKPHKDADLINRLLAELSPLDVRQLFICHKDAFYAAYAGWPESQKAYVANFLEREYQVDKAGTRAALFGNEADMSEPDPVKASPWSAGQRRDIVDRVGPWGAINRRM